MSDYELWQFLIDWREGENPTIQISIARDPSGDFKEEPTAKYTWKDDSKEVFVFWWGTPPLAEEDVKAFIKDIMRVYKRDTQS